MVHIKRIFEVCDKQKHQYTEDTCVLITYSLLLLRSLESSVGIALSYRLDDRGFDSRQGLGTFLSTTVSRPALGPTQPPIQWLSEALSLGLKRPGSENDHSPPSSAEVKNAWSYTSNPAYAFVARCLVKQRDFTLPYLYLYLYPYPYRPLYWTSYEAFDSNSNRGTNVIELSNTWT
jgi:hypothetical protein